MLLSQECNAIFLATEVLNIWFDEIPDIKFKSWLLFMVFSQEYIASFWRLTFWTYDSLSLLYIKITNLIVIYGVV